MTQFDIARRCEVSPEMKTAAEIEGVDTELLREGIAAGTIVLPSNQNRHRGKPTAIGAGLRIKVNANIGESSEGASLDDVMTRLGVALEAGADAVMDLSTGGNLDDIRRSVLAGCPVPLGTVPIYQAAIEAARDGRGLTGMDPAELFAVIEKHASDGVDFITVHCGVTRETAKLALEGERLTGVVSRGGAMTICWMRANDRENPLYEHFDRLLEICRAHDVTLSLGDGLRPGCLADGTDAAQVAETTILGQLVLRARSAGVQAMVEGPGHLPLDHVAANVALQKRLCHGAPFYVLGPLVTDVTPGYDHISGAIGGALAGMAGADFLCYLTPAEHLGLPNPSEVRDGVIAARIAAHAADIVRLGTRARAWDDEMARARSNLDWDAQYRLAINPARASSRHERAGEVACSMCGPYCVFSLLGKATTKEN